MEAFVGADCVGVVSRMSLDLAWSALQGDGKASLRGRIVKAEPYDLTMECEVGVLAELPQEDSDLSQYIQRTCWAGDWACRQNRKEGLIWKRRNK